MPLRVRRQATTLPPTRHRARAPSTASWCEPPGRRTPPPSRPTAHGGAPARHRRGCMPACARRMLPRMRHAGPVPHGMPKLTRGCARRTAAALTAQGGRGAKELPHKTDCTWHSASDVRTVQMRAAAAAAACSRCAGAPHGGGGGGARAGWDRGRPRLLRADWPRWTSNLPAHPCDHLVCMRPRTAMPEAAREGRLPGGPPDRERHLRRPSSDAVAGGRRARNSPARPTPLVVNAFVAWIAYFSRLPTPSVRRTAHLGSHAAAARPWAPGAGSRRSRRPIAR